MVDGRLDGKRGPSLMSELVGDIREDVRSKFFLWLSLCATLIATMLFALPNLAMADGEEDLEKASFYRTSVTASVFFDHYLGDVAEGDTSTDDTNDFSALLAGNAGGLVGYPDSVYGDTPLGSFLSFFSGSSSNASYDTLDTSDPGLVPIKAYVLYGSALRQLGFDETSSGGFGDMSDLLRSILGSVLLVSYWLAASAQFVFNAMLQILQFLNPFAWFFGVDRNSGVLNSALESMRATAGSGDNNPFGSTVLSGITDFFSHTYDVLYEMSTTILIVIWLLIMICGIFLFRNKGNGKTAFSHVKDFFVRVLFVGFAVPICGICYTQVLANFVSMTSPDTVSSANNVVYSSLLDFQSWVESNNLNLPASVGAYSGASGTTPVKIKVDSNSNQIAMDDNEMISSRAMALKINEQNLGTYEKGKFTTGDNWIEGAKDANSLLMRYVANSDYSESAYESYYKGTELSPSSRENFFKGLAATSDMATYDKYGATLFEPGTTIDDDPDANISYMSDGNLTATLSGSVFTYSPEGVSSDQGLSTLAMYNYLHSSFDETSFNVYSSKAVSSGFVREVHKAITTVGPNLLNKMLNIAASAMELLAIGMIGWSYAFAMVVSIMKNGIKMITALPGAFFGSFRFMAKMVTYVAMMIVELVVTVLIFIVIANAITMLNNVINNNVIGAIFGNLANNLQRFMSDGSVDGDHTAMISLFAAVHSDGSSYYHFSTDGAMASPLVMGISAGLSIVLNFYIIRLAMTLRKSLVQSTVEVLGQAVDRAFGVSGAGSSLAKEGADSNPFVRGMAAAALGARALGRGAGAVGSSVAAGARGLGAGTSAAGYFGAGSAAAGLLGASGAKNALGNNDNAGRGSINGGAEDESLNRGGYYGDPGTSSNNVASGDATHSGSGGHIGGVGGSSTTSGRSGASVGGNGASTIGAAGTGAVIGATAANGSGQGGSQGQGASGQHGATGDGANGSGKGGGNTTNVNATTGGNGRKDDEGAAQEIHGAQATRNDHGNLAGGGNGPVDPADNDVLNPQQAEGSVADVPDVPGPRIESSDEASVLNNNGSDDGGTSTVIANGTDASQTESTSEIKDARPSETSGSYGDAAAASDSTIVDNSSKQDAYGAENYSTMSSEQSADAMINSNAQTLSENDMTTKQDMSLDQRSAQTATSIDNHSTQTDGPDATLNQKQAEVFGVASSGVSQDTNKPTPISTRSVNNVPATASNEQSLQAQIASGNAGEKAPTVNVNGQAQQQQQSQQRSVSTTPAPNAMSAASAEQGQSLASEVQRVQQGAAAPAPAKPQVTQTTVVQQVPLKKDDAGVAVSAMHEDHFDPGQVNNR